MRGFSSFFCDLKFPVPEAKTRLDFVQEISGLCVTSALLVGILD